MMGNILSPDVVSGGYAQENDDAAIATDQQLIESVARGDELAFVELYSRHKIPLYNYLLRLLNDQATAEDILQEVFVAVWKGAGSFKARASVKTWIFRIAHNQAISWIRRQKPVVEQEEMLFLVDQNADLEHGLLQAWNADQLRLVLEQLSPVHRSVVELSFVHGLSYPEIAEVMDSPLGTIKSRMSYALRYLNALLKQNGFDD